MHKVRSAMVLFSTTAVFFAGSLLDNTGVEAAGVAMAEILPASGAALTLEEGTAVEEIYVEETKEENTDRPGIAESGSGSVSSEELFGGDDSTLDDILATAGGEEVIEFDSFAAGAAVGIEEISEEELEAAHIREAADVSTAAVAIGSQVSSEIKDEEAAAIAEAEARDPEHFANLVIAKCSGAVNVRDIPSTDGEVVGKLYDKSVGTFIEEEDGWYKISYEGGTGYVSADYLTDAAPVYTGE